MSRSRVPAILLAALALLAGAGISAGDAAPPAPAPAPAMTMEPADQAAPKLGRSGKIDKVFAAKHESFLKRGKEGPVGVLFIGDSITAGWDGAKEVWDSHYGALQPANFGIGGDRTQHVLWRIDNGELDGTTPKVVVLMIGTNNIRDSVENIAKGVVAIVTDIHAKLPAARLLLLGIFPRGADPKLEGIKGMRNKITAVNAELAKVDDGARTRYLDIGPRFLDADGVLARDIMPDALHPSAKGYQIWADAMQPLLDEMLK
jgi:lysophospholipase L1-like esterase